MAVNKDDPYFASLVAAYIISHVGGLSRKHLTGDNNVLRVLRGTVSITI